MKLCYIDFEFTNICEDKLKLICCSIKTEEHGIEEFWLLNSDYVSLVSRLDTLHELGYIFVAHGVSAEASSFLSMNIYAPKFKWICTMAEWRQLTNHNHDLQYGNHLVKGKEVYLHCPKPKWERTGDDDKSGKLVHSLSEMLFKLTDTKIDTDHKNIMRDICIRGNDAELEANRDSIQKYCTSDILHLPKALEAMKVEYSKLLIPEDFELLDGDMLLRGNTMAHNAVMERNGYPIAFNNLRNFTLQIQDILNECAEDINSQFPEMGIFVFNKKTGSYAKREKPIREWIEESNFSGNWLLTATGNYSLSLDAFGANFHFRHSYPRFNFGAQILRYLKLKQSLNGFSPNAKKKNFWSAVGSDRRVRSYLNPYGSLSSRYQPPATSFLFLKPAWFRSLCVPPKGKMVVGIDYKSEEFFISGLWSNDRAMIDAYMSGDVYMAFAIDSGMVPEGSNKASHPTERQSAKSAVLGISYLMTKYGLSKKMAQDLMREVSEEEAQVYIDLFDETYHVHCEAVQVYLETFSDEKYGRLLDGWVLFGDNENFRSVANFPKQGMGAVILRRAIAMANNAGLKVIAPLHDAAYFEIDLGDWKALELCCKIMKEAFYSCYEDTEVYEDAKGIMIDVEVWSPELEDGSFDIHVEGKEQKVSVESIHRDDRAGDEYEKFKKYFKAPSWSLL